MKPAIRKHIDLVLGHLYINPLEKCNLRCKICYTRKTAPILKKEEIISFISRYNQALSERSRAKGGTDRYLQTITFCGGEVFTLPWFPELMNTCVAQGIFVQVITNGTIDKLHQLENPNFVNLIVSIDGLKHFHDANRGEGTFDTSLAFLKKARSKGFHIEIFSIIHHQNLPHIDEFEAYLKNELGPINITYHPRKPPAYLEHNPNSNIWGTIDGFNFLSRKEMVTVMKERNVFPPKNLGCYQIALVSDGRVFGCCEGVTPIGRMSDEIPDLFHKLEDRIELWEKTNTMHNCLGCSQPEFMCGIKEYLEFSSSRTWSGIHIK